MSCRRITTCLYSAPCGKLRLADCGDSLCLCDWQAARHHGQICARLQRTLGTSMEEGNSPTLQQAASELDEYFAGERQLFTLPLLPIGTEFRQRVWQALQALPCGSTLTYGQLAQRLGMPAATRAVANAVGANALSLFIPCHRIISSGGRLGGYAGGTTAKQYLLKLEGAPCPCGHPSRGG